MFAEAGPIGNPPSPSSFAEDAGRAGGLTLLSLVGLMVLLVILLVAMVATASWVRQSGRERLTRRTLESLAQAVKVYQQSTGEFPPAVSSNADLLRYLGSVQASGQALQEMPAYAFRSTAGGREILDGWSRPLQYVYVFDPKSNNRNNRPELFSHGRDAQDPADDLYADSLRTVPMTDLPERLD